VALALGVAVLLPSGLKAASDSDAVAYRRHVMRTMSEQAAALGLVLQKRGPAENAALHARTIALAAEAAVKAFELQAPGGEAKPEIWLAWPDFEKRLNALSAGASDLAVIAERDGLDAMQAKAMSVLTCKSCHDTYTLRQGR
jgi:cytochrome c556